MARLALVLALLVALAFLVLGTSSSTGEMAGSINAAAGMHSALGSGGGPALAPALAEDESTITVGHVPRGPGDRFEISSVAEVKLQAEIGAGFLAQTVSYDLREEERLEIEVLEPGDEGALRCRVGYPVRKATTVAPIVGRKTKDRRVARSTYVAEEGEGGLVVHDETGEASAPVKEAKYVVASWPTLELEPALHLLLEDGELVPGQELQAEAAIARRLLGLPLEELVPESLTLTVVGPADDGTVRLDLVAELSGAAEVAGRDVSLTAELSGPLFVDPATGRTARLELEGTTTIVADAEDALLSARGEGTFTFKRMLRDDTP
jgi:hypothetical protein